MNNIKTANAMQENIDDILPTNPGSTENERCLISLVIPVFNEEKSIVENVHAIMAAARSDHYDLEVVLIDDGSIDNTALQLRALSESSPMIRPIYFTRNFGKESAILAGLSACQGNAAVVLDSDLQHPPELIKKMVALWENGLLVVEAIKQERGKESIAQKLFASGFYSLFSWFAKLDLRGHSDFKLLDRQVIDTYITLPERNRFFRGLISWAGYPSAQLPFSVAERNGGSSSWNRLNLLRYAINNITGFSSAPLKLITYLGAFTLSIGMILAAITLTQKFFGINAPGFATVNLLIITLGGVIMLSLGIIGHYLARIHDEIKGRPAYLLRKMPHNEISINHNFNNGKSED